MVKISSNSEVAPKGNSPNLVKLAWNDPNALAVLSKKIIVILIYSSSVI